MKKINSIKAFTYAWILLLTPYSFAEAALITFAYEATITEADTEPGSTHRALFNTYLGESIRIIYTFDTTASDTHTSTSRAQYSITTAQLQLGIITYDSVPDNFGKLFITDNDSVFEDRYGFSTHEPTGPNIGGLTLSAFGFDLEHGINSAVFSSTELPLIQPDPADFEYNGIWAIFEDMTSGELVGLYADETVQISSVPIPASLYLFISGIITLFGVCANKRQHKHPY